MKARLEAAAPVRGANARYGSGTRPPGRRHGQPATLSIWAALFTVARRRRDFSRAPMKAGRRNTPPDEIAVQALPGTQPGTNCCRSIGVCSSPAWSHSAQSETRTRRRARVLCRCVATLLRRFPLLVRYVYERVLPGYMADKEATLEARRTDRASQASESAAPHRIPNLTCRRSTAPRIVLQLPKSITAQSA